MATVNGDVMTRFTQLPLGVRLRETATFANYFPGVNRDVVRLLQASVSGERGFIYLWGGRGSGKTHLLQAVCHLVSSQTQPLAYFPLRETASLSPGILEGMEQLPLVIVDDVEAIAGDAAWERGLFHLYNRIRERDGGLIMAGAHSPAAIGIALPDLRTRLAAGLVLQLRPLDDAGKAEALRLQARQKGMEMPGEVAAYLLRHCPRDMTALFALLDVLDQASLAAQRKLTVPFVREVLQHV
ncbi:MAG: DnaA regulatory inactivator Hda [Gammaproteobacteria bacterium]|jgi:DnaA family protein